MDDSFFELVTRYSERAQHDPGENRLTAVLTAVLQVRRSLARALLQQLLPDLVLRGDPTVQTQKTVQLADGRHAFLDMEIASVEPPQATVWIEVKRTSRESGSDQFEKYQQTLEGLPGQRALLVLAPTHMKPHLGVLQPAAAWRHESPVSPLWVSWEEVYVALKELLSKSEDPWETWAVREFLRYLKWEGLQPVPVTQAHAAALANITEASKALAMLVTNTQEHLAPTIDRPCEVNNASRDYYYESRYAASAVAPGRGWSERARFGWGVDDAKVFAGICTPGDQGPIDGMDAGAIENWRASFGKPEWEHIPGVEYWIWKVLPLDGLEATGGIDAQAERVTAFVCGAFAEVVAAFRM